MLDSILRRPIHRIFSTGRTEEIKDEIVKEHRFQIRLDGKDYVQAVLTPDLLEEFVLGFLRTRGLIHRLEDVISLEITEDAALVVRSPHQRQTFPDFSLLESTGSRTIGQDAAFQLSAGIPVSKLRVSSGVIFQGVGLLAEMPIYKRTGGTHCAILFSEKGEPLFSAEDIGRHNAVDKTVGGAMRRGVDFGTCWLAVSGRLPADMVLKAVAVGLPLMASVSAPTSEGIDVAERFGLTVIGFVRGAKLNCYCHPERILS